MEIFQELGRHIGEEWSRADFDNQRLPEIAAAGLHALRPWERVHYEDIVEWVVGAREFPSQVGLDSKFGQPPITLYWQPRFYIEALFWTTATTAIHQHRFSGAFAVLAGSSLQTRYRFSPRQRINEHLTIGDLALHDMKRLQIGDVEPIRSGTALIHSVFHLETPSVTLVVRTPGDVESGVQYQYLRPHLAINTFFTDPLMVRRSQVLELMERLRSPRYEEMALRALECADFLETYWILSRADSVLRGREGLGRLLEAARRRHGAKVDLLLPVFEATHREALLMSRRDRITNAEHRFFLALLSTLPDRDSILAMVGRTCQDSTPRETVMRWVTELSGTDVLGIEMDAVNISVFRHLLDGLSPAEVFLRLRGEYSAEDLSPQEGEVLEHCRRIRDLAAFRNLLDASPGALATVLP
jgi:hypothetical protein